MPLGNHNLLNYINNSTRRSPSSLSTLLKRSFARVGLTYGYDDPASSQRPPAPRNYFNYLNFQNFAGPNPLAGISHQP